MGSGIDGMTAEFESTIWYWKGPAPHYFVTVPAEQCESLRAVQGSVTYGWGMIPVKACINDTEWTTSLFPKDGRFIVPIKVAVRKSEKLEEGDSVTIRLEVSIGRN